MPLSGRIVLSAVMLAALASACNARPDATPTIAAATVPATALATIPAPPSATEPPVVTATPVPSSSPVPTIASLKATVSADRLSCRYGPGPEYLYLYGLRKGVNIVLVGRTDAENWHWVYVQGRSKCWVNTNFVDIQGDWRTLPVVYPGIAKLPVSPYYPRTSVLSAVRKGNEITVEWLDIPLRAGDEEDASMLRYIVEVWRCENGALIFEPLATNELNSTFTDQPGCTAPSHGRIFVQEKHGFSGPTEIPWPRP